MTTNPEPNPLLRHFTFRITFLLAAFSIFLICQLLASTFTSSHNIPATPSTHSGDYGPDEAALGLYLAPSYATAAIAFPNGTVEPVGKVEGDDGYAEVIQRLQRSSSVHLHKPYYGLLLGPDVSERFRQWKRSFRRKLGLPSSSDVGTLSTPLQALVSTATHRVACRPRQALLVTTAIRALYDEDIQDIMTYLGLTQAPLRHLPGLRAGCEAPHELAAAYAGHGFGLCETYWNATACDLEERQISFEMVVGVSISRTGIALSQAVLRYAYVIDGYDETLYDAVGFEGFGGEDRMRQSMEEYWRFVEKALKCHVHRNNRYNVSKVLIFDDAAEMEVDGHTMGYEMKSVVTGVLREWQDDVKVLKSEPLYVTAFGAAKLALRGRYVRDKDQEIGERWREKELKKKAPNPLGCHWYAYNLAGVNHCR